MNMPELSSALLEALKSHCFERPKHTLHKSAMLLSQELMIVPCLRQPVLRVGQLAATGLHTMADQVSHLQAARGADPASVSSPTSVFVNEAFAASPAAAADPHGERPLKAIAVARHAHAL